MNITDPLAALVAFADAAKRCRELPYRLPEAQAAYAAMFDAVIDTHIPALAAALRAHAAESPPALSESERERFFFNPEGELTYVRVGEKYYRCEPQEMLSPDDFVAACKATPAPSPVAVDTAKRRFEEQKYRNAPAWEELAPETRQFWIDHANRNPAAVPDDEDATAMFSALCKLAAVMGHPALLANPGTGGLDAALVRLATDRLSAAPSAGFVVDEAAVVRALNAWFHECDLTDFETESKSPLFQDMRAALLAAAKQENPAPVMAGPASEGGGQAMNAAGLLPCPFCGEPPYMGVWGAAFSKHPDATAIECGCDLGDCPVNPSVTGFTQAEAIAAWNRRTLAREGQGWADEEIRAAWARCLPRSGDEAAYLLAELHRMNTAAPGAEET